MSETIEPGSPKEKTSKFPIIVLGIIGVGLVGYCIFGAIVLFRNKQTVAASPTEPTSNNAPTPSQKAQALMDESEEWAVVFEETFESTANGNGWNYGEFSTDQMDGNLDIIDGKYKFEVVTKDMIFVRLNPMTNLNLKNFRLFADVKLTSGTYNPVYGIVFRDTSGDDHYSFGIRGETFIIDKSYGGQFTIFVDEQKSKAILPQESNRLTVIGKGSFFVFLINDQYVYELTDNDIQGEGFGFRIGFFREDLNNTFEFDNFMIQTP